MGKGTIGRTTGFDVCIQSPRLRFHCSFYSDNLNIGSWGDWGGRGAFVMLTSPFNLLHGISTRASAVPPGWRSGVNERCRGEKSWQND